jgi:putative membrane protein insertion efficiency factor
MSYLSWLWRGPLLACGRLMIFCVRGYQTLLRPLLPPLCRFQPGCSEYFILSVKKHGPLIGTARHTFRESHLFSRG